MDFDPHSHQVTTVLGPVSAGSLGALDAHNHMWIEPVPGAPPGGPVLNRFEPIRAELTAYRQAGGSSQTDCQPPLCGRNGLRLAELSRLSQVHIVGCTGFHLQRYYPPDFWLWQASAEQAAGYFIAELEQGMVETRPSGTPVYPGFIKAACQAELALTPQAALEGAAQAAFQTGAALGIHTEKGAQAEHILAFFTRQGLPADRLILFHIDKRPDLGLQRELAQAGVLLEYDTFYRPKYDPDHRLWPLIEQMTAAGFEDSLAFGTDMAESEFWQSLSGGPGLPGLLNLIQPRLRSLGLDETCIQKITGGNLARRLSRKTKGT